MWEKIVQIQQQRRKAALCVIVETRGSTPRKAGSKLLVTEDGEFFGTVGGGNLEYYIIEQAKRVIQSQRPVLLTHNLHKDFKMACGGQVKIYIEPIMPKNQLILFGAGHIAKALARFASEFDFDIVVVDPRKDVVDSWDFKKNVKFVTQEFEKAFDSLQFDQRTYVCSLAYTHELDLRVAALVLRKPFAYLGVIASKNKARKIRKALVEDYGFSPELVEKIDMPMGIPINSQTPAEIAISILAKIIDVKNKSQSDESRQITERQPTVQIAQYSANSHQGGD